MPSYRDVLWTSRPARKGGRDRVVSGYGRAGTQVDSGRDTTVSVLSVVGEPGQVVCGAEDWAFGDNWIVSDLTVQLWSAVLALWIPALKAPNRRWVIRICCPR